MKIVGSISNYLKSFELNRIWEMKKLNQANLFSKSIFEPVVKEDVKEIAMRTDRIISKLRRGQELSAYDMEHLRKHAPAYYEKAKQIKKEREEYRRELQSCRSKEVVRRIRDVRRNQCHTGTGANGHKDVDFEFAGMSAQAFEDEYRKFASTARYKTLPERISDHIGRDPAGRDLSSGKFNHSRRVATMVGKGAESASDNAQYNKNGELKPRGRHKSKSSVSLKA